MLYDASKPLDVLKAKAKFENLIATGKVFELKEKMPKRTLRQNNYLHLILSWFAIEYGETLEYVKQRFFKEIVNAEIFKTEYVNRKTGEIRESLISTADLQKDELTTAITRFRNWSAQQGIYLPSPDDLSILQQIEIEIEKHKEYL